MYTDDNHKNHKNLKLNSKFLEIQYDIFNRNFVSKRKLDHRKNNYDDRKIISRIQL